jgi:hypothetical protein
VSWGYPERGKVLLFGGDLIMAAAAAIFAGNFHPMLPSASTQPAGRIVLASFYFFSSGRALAAWGWEFPWLCFSF